MQPTNCPECAAVLEVTVPGCVEAKGLSPEPGNYSVCFQCAALLRFNDDMSLSKSDINDIPAGARPMVERAIEMVKALRNVVPASKRLQVDLDIVRMKETSQPELVRFATELVREGSDLTKLVGVVVVDDIANEEGEHGVMCAVIPRTEVPERLLLTGQPYEATILAAIKEKDEFPMLRVLLLGKGFVTSDSLIVSSLMQRGGDA